MVSFLSALARLCCPSSSDPRPEDRLPPVRCGGRRPASSSHYSSTFSSHYSSTHTPLHPLPPTCGGGPISKGPPAPERRPSSVYSSYSKFMNDCWKMKCHWAPPPKALSGYPDVDPSRYLPRSDSSDSSSTHSQPSSRRETSPSQPQQLQGVAPVRRKKRGDLKYDFAWEYGSTPESSMTPGERAAFEIRARREAEGPRPRTIVPPDPRPCGYETEKRRRLAAKCGHAYKAAKPPAQPTPPPPPPPARTASEAEPYVSPRSQWTK